MARENIQSKKIPIFYLFLVKIVLYWRGIETTITRSTAISIKWNIEARMKKKGAIYDFSSKFSTLFHSLEIEIKEIIATDKLDKQSETDKLAIIISYILFLRLILAINIISARFKMASSTPVKSLILGLSFISIIFRWNMKKLCSKALTILINEQTSAS